MEVILLKDVEKVGLRGEVVNVARGYARNFLLPRKLAELASVARVAELKKLDEQRARHEARSVDQAQEIAGVLSKTVLRFDVKSGPTGALFGSVTTTDIADELWRTRKVRVDRKKIDTDALKRIGRYAIPIQVFEGVTVEVKTLVVPEGGELPPDEELAAMEAAEAARIAEEQAAAQAACGQAESATAAAEVEYLDDSAPEQTPAEAAEAAEFELPDAALEPASQVRAGSRFRGPLAPFASTFPRDAPQGCGASRELPALSGTNGHVSCGQFRCRAGAAVRPDGENQGNMCSFLLLRSTCRLGRRPVDPHPLTAPRG